ncbi:MAG: hypothetical protein RRC07_15455 [Anaerolineae bacterium]|nr:hypothetical protein [Anaerolineae bacterium]
MVTFYSEHDPAWTGPRSWVEIGLGGRRYTPTPASEERLRRLPLRFVAFKGNLPGEPSGERTRSGARYVYEGDG